jgi:hypothetical protein
MAAEAMMTSTKSTNSSTGTDTTTRAPRGRKAGKVLTQGQASDLQASIDRLAILLATDKPVALGTAAQVVELAKGASVQRLTGLGVAKAAAVKLAAGEVTPLAVLEDVMADIRRGVIADLNAEGIERAQANLDELIEELMPAPKQTVRVPEGTKLGAGKTAEKKPELTGYDKVLADFLAASPEAEDDKLITALVKLRKADADGARWTRTGFKGSVEVPAPAGEKGMRYLVHSDAIDADCLVARSAAQDGQWVIDLVGVVDGAVFRNPLEGAYKTSSLAMAAIDCYRDPKAVKAEPVKVEPTVTADEQSADEAAASEAVEAGAVEVIETVEAEESTEQVPATV